MDDAEPAVLRFAYTFAFDDGATRSFEVVLDHRTLAVARSPAGPLPEWTRDMWLSGHRAVIESLEVPSALSAVASGWRFWVGSRIR